jgi:hypothetical protein
MFFVLYTDVTSNYQILVQEQLRLFSTVCMSLANEETCRAQSTTMNSNWQQLACLAVNCSNAYRDLQSQLEHM